LKGSPCESWPFQSHSTRQPTSHFVAIRSIQNDERSCSLVRPRFDPIAAPGHLLRQSPEKNRAPVENRPCARRWKFLSSTNLRQAPSTDESRATNFESGQAFLRCSEFCCPKSSEIQPHQHSSMMMIIRRLKLGEG